MVNLSSLQSCLCCFSTYFCLQLREDKIDLENALEAESESHVNRLARELGALRTANGELEAQLAEARRALSSADEHLGEVVIGGPAATSHMSGWAGEPSMGLVLDALRRENEVLRQQLADSQRNYVRISRFNELYREELIEHRTRVSLFKISPQTVLTVLIAGPLG